MSLEFASDVAEIFRFDENIRSAVVVDRIGNVVSLASRTTKPLDTIFVRDVASKWVALFGGMLRGGDETFGVLRWIHLRYNRLHVYCWPVFGGYLAFTSRAQLNDMKLLAIGSSGIGRARTSDSWKE